MNKNSDVCPYNLTVVIHKAENLAIADITSSDPYVIVSIGKNVFLRTQTIYRNRKNPKWEEKAKIGLLNIYDTLKINVFDENQVSNDKMLGTVSIDMTTIPYNEECEQTLVLVGENGLSTPPCGKIYVSLILQKYSTTVCLQSRSPDHHINKISPEVMSYLQSTLTFHNLQSGPFELSFIRSPFMTLTPSEISEGRITDILLDVKALVTGDNEPTQSYSRRNYSICSSTSIDSSNFRCSPSVPFKKLSILFVKFCTVSNSNMATSNILVFRNKHTLWVWTRWLRVAFAFWQGTLAEEDLPMWVVESSHQISDSTLRLYSDGEKSGKVKGRFTLSLFEPYRINCRDLKSGNVNCFIDLRVVASIRISMDSPVHQRYRIQIDQISTNLSVHDQRFVGMLSDINIILKGTERFDLSRADDSENNNNGRQSMSPRAFTFNCHSIALDVETSKHSESNSSPNPGSEINPTTSDVISTMTDYSGFHVYLCSSDKSVLPDLPLPSVLPDLSSLPTLPNLPSVALASQLKNAISAPTLLAHKYVLYSDILNGPAKEEFTRLNTQIDPLLTNSSTIAMSLKMAPTYNSSLIIKLLAADFDWYNSHHPQSDTLDSSSTSFIVRCSACDWRGKESKAINEIDSPHFSVGKTPNFDNYEFSIPFNTSAWTNVCFVKLKLYLLKGIVVSEFRKKGLGVFLIPFVDFFHQSKTPASTPASSETTSSIRDYDVVLEPMTIPKKVHHQTIQKGTIKVKLGVSNGGNRSTATDITESPTTVDLKFKLHSNLLYQTEWAAEAFLANDQTAKSIELCNVFANFDGLNIKLRNVTQQTSEDVDEDNDDDDDENDNATSTANTTNTGGVSSSSSKSVAETAGPLTPAISSVTEAPMKSSHSHVPSQAQIETQRDNKPNSSFLSLCGCGSSSGTIGSVVSDSFRSPRSEVVQRRRSTVVSERQMLYTAHKDAALSTCQERTNFNSDWVSIQWSQVTSVFEVTDSVLSLNIKVNRYFGEDKSRNAIFRPASVEIFIVNCPSKQLRTFIDERMTFAELRGSIVARGSDASIMNDLNDDAVSLERRGKELKASMSDISGAIPKSTRRDMIRILSRSCRIRAYIATVLFLGMRTYQSVHGVYDNTSVIEKAKVMREWEEDAAQRVKQDLLAVRAIETTNVVSTFTEKIQYLVNAAGAHITEVSMRGWSYREHLGPFGRFVEIMANEYLIEITSQISLFFAKNEEFLNLKGLGNKLLVITTFTKQNDNFDNLLRVALRPYDLKVQPHARLLLFFNFDVLLQWYSMILQQEMTTTVREVISLWSDPSKNMGGLASMYTTKLPWLPSRLNDGEGIFMTSIPEDVRTKLNIYLHVARVNQSDVAESLKEKINKLDDKLYISFADAILKLSEEYWKAAALVSPLCGGARPTLHGENSEEVIKAYGTEFEEISEWFCSVANDAKRICADTTILDMIKEIVNRNKEDDKKDEINNDDDIGFGISSNFNSFKRRDVAEDDSMTSSALIDQAHQSFQATSQIALEVVSSVMFRLLFSVTDSIFMNANAHLVWIPMESPAHTSAAGSIKTHDQTKCFSDCLNDILAWLDSRRAYLTPQCFRELVYFSLEKVVVRYLHMLLIALVSGNRQIYVGGDEHDAIQGDAVHIMNRFLMLLEDGSNSENNIFQTQLSTSFPFRLLNFMLSLLGADFIGSSQITETLTAIGVLAKDSPRCAHALCNFATCIISLREDTGKKIEFQKRKSDPKRMSSTGNHGSSESLLSGTSSHHWPSFFSSSKPPPASETVKAQSTHTSAEDNTSSVSTTPSTSTATTQKNTSGSGQTSKSISHFFTFSKKDPTTDLNTSSTAIIDESAIARNKILKGILEKLEQIRVVGDQPGNIDRLSCHGLNLVFSDPSLGVKPKTINDVLFECQPVENLKRSIFGADGMSAKAGDDSGSDSDDETLSTYDIEIHTLSLSNIELGSTKLKPVLHISISGDRETTKTPVGIFDPVTSQYTWRDFALVLPVTATKVNYNSLIFELHYSRGLMPSKLIGSASVPLTGLHITDNIANHSCYIMPNDASKVVATGGNDVGSQYPHLVLNVRKIDSE